MVNNIRKGLVFGTLFVLVFVTFAGLPMNVGAEPTTIYVDDDNTSGTEDGSIDYPYNTIQEGIDAASTGDTVYLFAGTYCEEVTISIPLTLEGENKDTTIIMGPSVYQSKGIYSNSISGITIKNLKIQGFDWGIYLEYITDSLVQNIVAKNNGVGIFIFHSDNNIIKNNIFYDNGWNTIYLRYANNNKVIDNIISGGTDGIGIWIGYAEDNEIIGNTISDNEYGIWLWFTNKRIKICENTITGNSESGTFMAWGEGHTISKNTITNNDANGIEIWDSYYDHTINENTVSNNGNDGIYIIQSSYFVINKNVVSNNGNRGISLRHTAHCTLRNNILTGNKYNFDIDIDRSSLTSVKHDIDTTNTVDGKPIYYLVDQSYQTVPSDAGYVGIVNSDHIIVKDLKLSGNGEGVLFAFTTDSTIKNVEVKDNYDGIFMCSPDNNIINNNKVTNNYYGVRVIGFGSGNIITGNTILNNNYGIYTSSRYPYLTGNTINGNILSDNEFAIYLGSDTNSNKIYGNIVSNNNNGIYLNRAYSNKIYGNIFSNNNNGIYLYRADSNIINWNSISDNSYGIYIEKYSDYNEIYHNNIIDNTNQVHNYYTNIWDNGAGEGNYWSDYEGLDDGSNGRTANDGIGDTDIPHLGVDNYPLMENWGAEDEIEDFIEVIEDMELPTGTENNLVAKLEDTLKLLEKENFNGAIQKIGDFINYVEAQRGKKLTDNQADELIAAAELIIFLIIC